VCLRRTLLKIYTLGAYSNINYAFDYLTLINKVTRVIVMAELPTFNDVCNTNYWNSHLPMVRIYLQIDITTDSPCKRMTLVMYSYKMYNNDTTLGLVTLVFNPTDRLPPPLCRAVVGFLSHGLLQHQVLSNNRAAS